MKVSILISNYNYARYLPAAIDSVLAQTYPDFELIIVDDGSTDNSREVISQYQQRSPDKIKVIFQENQGQGAAFNSGFKVASGEIIAFLDADDVWKPNKLERIVEAFRNSDIVGVMHQLETVDGEGKLLEAGDTNLRITTQDLSKLILATGGVWMYPPTSALTYRRSVLEVVIPIDSVKWRLWADGCLVYYTAFLGKIQTLHEVLGSYRIHGKNNHASKSQLLNSEQQTKWVAGIRTTNQELNAFLERINYPQRVDLERNLNYRRTLFYWCQKWNIKEILAISILILQNPFYTIKERALYLARFWLKSLKFLLNLNLYTNKKTSTTFF